MVSVPKPHTNTALGLSAELLLALESIFPGMTSNQQNLITVREAVIYVLAEFR